MHGAASSPTRTGSTFPGLGEPLVLGSASPRRRDILAQLRVPFVVVVADVDEAMDASQEPHAGIERIARAKLDRVMAHVARDRVVLCADTAVLVREEALCILGKPSGTEEARAMLLRLSGREHEVCTAFALGRGGALLHVERVSTRVWFRAVGQAEVDAYVASGEGLDKAGAYGAQGLGAALISRIDGSYTNVVGLPACEVLLALRALPSPGDG